MRTTPTRRSAWRRGRSWSRVALVAGAATYVVFLTVPAAPAYAVSGAKIADFAASPSTVRTTNGTVDITATVKKAAACTLSVVPTLPGLPVTAACSGAFSFQSVLPRNGGANTLDYRFTLAAIGARGDAKADLVVGVEAGAGGLPPPLSGVAGLASDGAGSCALTSSAGVDCWGVGSDGELGNVVRGTSAVPVAVLGVGGTGLLSNVVSLSSDAASYCALTSSAGVDCWGSGSDGELGNGVFADSAVPVAVVGVDGSGLLSGVVALSADGYGFCALTISAEVDCWGSGSDGELGNGVFADSAVPVAVVGVDGSGLLSGVVALSAGGFGYCALMSSTGVDCWGEGEYGQLGNRALKDSGVPVRVVGVTGTGTLRHVAALTSAGPFGATMCALMGSRRVD